MKNSDFNTLVKILESKPKIYLKLDSGPDYGAIVEITRFTFQNGKQDFYSVSAHPNPYIWLNTYSKDDLPELKGKIEAHTFHLVDPSQLADIIESLETSPDLAKLPLTVTEGSQIPRFVNMNAFLVSLSRTFITATRDNSFTNRVATWRTHQIFAKVTRKLHRLWISDELSSSLREKGLGLAIVPLSGKVIWVPDQDHVDVRETYNLVPWDNPENFGGDPGD